MASCKGEDVSDSVEDCHYRRMKCIYLDDLVSALNECHENFLLVKENLISINKQLTVRRCPPDADKLIKTQKGLVNECAHRLQEAMKEVLQAIEEHFYSELSSSSERVSQDKLWTLTEELMSQPGGCGDNLLFNLATLVAGERKLLLCLEENYSLEEDLAKFKTSTSIDLPSPTAFDSLVENAQGDHVRCFLRTCHFEKETDKLKEELQELRNEYMVLLEQTAKKNGTTSDSQLRDLKEDWSHGIDERLELVAMEAEAKSMENVRQRLQKEVQSVRSGQDEVVASRDRIEKLRDEVQSNQKAVRQLTRRNHDGRKRLEETRSEVQRLSAECDAKLSQLSAEMKSALNCGQRCVSACSQQVPGANAACSPGAEGQTLSTDAIISRLARQVVAENEQSSIGQLDYARLMEAMRSRSEKLGALAAADRKECASSVQHKTPLVRMVKAAMDDGERHVQGLEKMILEQEELPKALQLPRSARK